MVHIRQEIQLTRFQHKLLNKKLKVAVSRRTLTPLIQVRSEDTQKSLVMDLLEQMRLYICFECMVTEKKIKLNNKQNFALTDHACMHGCQHPVNWSNTQMWSE